MSVIVARALTQRFASPVLALDSLDLEVGNGDRLAVLGPNGAGKTTLLRILATAAKPTSGTLEIFGFDALRNRSALRTRLGYVAHAPGLYPALSAVENLRFFCSLRGLPARRAEVALALVDLQDEARRPAAQLSRGMQQRLAIGRALLHDPELLLLDEPDAGLDAEGEGLLAALMNGRTVVMATHDQALAKRLCDRTLAMSAGRAVGDDERVRVVK
jgi:heme exporter protein A